MNNFQINTIAIQGVKYSFHYQAVANFFDHKVSCIECNTFKKAFEAVKNNKADALMIAIENSLAGSILPNYNLIREHDFKILGEIYLNIQLHLCALKGVEFKAIKKVISHPMALQQCGSFFEENPQLEIKESSDTALCAKTIQSKGLKDTATVCGIMAGENYNLNFLERRVETHRKNYTRFLLLGTHQTVLDGTNKASLCFELNHKVGSLYRLLKIFSQHHINMTKIQSVPIIGKPSEYNFYIDIEWREKELFDKSIHEILNFTKNFNILGMYRKAKFKP